MAAIPKNQLLAFVLIAVAGCALDLWTKSWIVAQLGMPSDRDATWIWQDVDSLTTRLNDGAQFGPGQGLTLVFAGLSLVAAVGIVYRLSALGAPHHWVLTISL